MGGSNSSPWEFTMKKILILLFYPLQLLAQPFTSSEISRWEKEANSVTVIRDNWGIPHVYAKTDAHAVFGLLYVQCEDDFQRVEMNYIEKLGRTAEVKGEPELYNDLLIRMIIDSGDAIADYKASPPWLKKLLDAYADGINYYIYKHPAVKPALLRRFEPWFPLLWTDGSIGAIDIGDVTTSELQEFYGDDHTVSVNLPKKEADDLPGGSNGFALAPSKTESGNAILYINPHVSFYFRPEVHVVSAEGLNVYGAVTWGQLFVYQGFNEHCGWMHTSSYTDVADLYAEKIVRKNGQVFYQYDSVLKPVRTKQITISYKAGEKPRSKTFSVYYTHHGPVMAMRNGQWIAVKANNRSMQSLIQSWNRTKCKTFEEYRKNMDLRANTSNNTVYADDKGNIAYWHGNFIPRRNPSINWAKPVDGSISATEWKGVHTLDEIVHVYNPASGWIQNCNSTPFTCSGSSSPRKENYPAYMAPDGQNFRGINAARILAAGDRYTIEKVIASGYNPHLAAFDVLIPGLLKAFEAHARDSVYQDLKEPISILSQWDRNTGVNSIATTVAIEWAQKLLPVIMKGYADDEESDQVEKSIKFIERSDAAGLLVPLQQAIADLNRKFGKWQMPWGEINRYQRLSGNLVEHFDDGLPSLPDGFAASTWGCLPSFASRNFSGTNKRYGYNGNSFICAVEFGKKNHCALIAHRR